MVTSRIARSFSAMLLAGAVLGFPRTVCAGDVYASVSTSIYNGGREVTVTVTGSGGCTSETVYGAFDRTPDGGNLWGPFNAYPFPITCWAKGSHTVNVVVWGGTRQGDGSCTPDSATASTSFVVTRNGSIFGVAYDRLGQDPSTTMAGLGIIWSLYGCGGNGLGFLYAPTDKSPARGDSGWDWWGTGDTQSGVLAPYVYGVGDADFVEASVWGCSEMQNKTMLPIPQKDNQCTPECSTCCAKQIKVTNGNMRAPEHDPLPGGGLQRTYDSTRSGESRWFGNGWSSAFDAYFRDYPDVDATHLQIVGTVGADRYLFRDFVQVFPPGPKPATLTYDTTAGLYAFREYGADTVTYFHGSDGTIAKTRSLSTGRETLYTFAGGAPTRVADSWGNWAWSITSAGGRIGSIAIDGTPIVWNYTYDGGGNLGGVDVNGNPWRTNTYSGNFLTQIADATGNLVESHTYNGTNAVSSTGAGSDDIQNMTYAPQTGRTYTVNGLALREDVTQVFWKSGATTTYSSRYVGGRRVLVQIDGGCVSCGAKNVTYGFDDQANPVREQDGRGYIVVTAWDGAHRVISKSGPYKPSGCDPETDAGHCRLDTDSLVVAALVGTPATKTTAYTWGDANWSDRPSSIATDSVLVPGQTSSETLVYDATTGTVTSHTTAGYSGSPASARQRTTTTALYNGSEAAAFDPGSVFSPGWLSLPQPSGLRKSVDGPRTDLSDVTSWVYYPLDSSVPSLLRGHLAATRNAAGHVTQFASYDVFGNPTRVVDPNGVATESTYDSLGRLLTSTVKGVAGCDTAADPLCATDLTSTRTYTPAAGPLASEQRPNGGVTVYTYDSRGRTATVSRGPSAGSMLERITYAYDPASGNKSSEVTAAFENGSWVTRRSETYTYNADALLSSVVHPDISTIAYTYGADGILASVKDENHTSPNTSYAYDPTGRLASVVQTLSTAAGGQITTRYAYDVQGHLSR